MYKSIYKSISMSEESIEKGGGARRFSIGGTSTPKALTLSKSKSKSDEKAVPHYLQASTGSCHDFCKYGGRKAFEQDQSRPNRSIKNQTKGLAFGERKKKDESPKWKDIVSYDTLSRTERKIVPSNNEKLAPVIKKDKISTKPKLVKQVSLPVIPSKPNLGRMGSMERSSSSAVSRFQRVGTKESKVLGKPGLRKGKEKIEMKMGNKSNNGDENEERTLYVIESKLPKIDSDSVEMTSDEKLVEESKPQITEPIKMVSEIEGEKEIAELFQGEEDLEKAKIILDLSQNEELIQLMQPVLENNEPEKEPVLKPEPGLTEPVAFISENVPKTSSSSELSQSDSSISENEEETETELESESELSGSFESESENDNQGSSANNESVKGKTESNRRRKGGSSSRNEGGTKPYKMKFKRGKVIEIPTDATTSLRRLRFRRGRAIGINPNPNPSGGDRQRSAGYRKQSGSENAGPVNPDPKSGSGVVLRHQDTSERKEGQIGLFNNVIEETASKLVESRKSKVKALVGAFETVISLQDGKPVSTA